MRRPDVRPTEHGDHIGVNAMRSADSIDAKRERDRFLAEVTGTAESTPPVKIIDRRSSTRTKQQIEH